MIRPQARRRLKPPGAGRDQKFPSLGLWWGQGPADTLMRGTWERMSPLFLSGPPPVLRSSSPSTALRGAALWGLGGSLLCSEGLGPPSCRRGCYGDSAQPHQSHCLLGNGETSAEPRPRGYVRRGCHAHLIRGLAPPIRPRKVLGSQPLARPAPGQCLPSRGVWAKLCSLSWGPGAPLTSIPESMTSVGLAGARWASWWVSGVALHPSLASHGAPGLGSPATLHEELPASLGGLEELKTDHAVGHKDKEQSPAPGLGAMPAA